MTASPRAYALLIKQHTPAHAVHIDALNKQLATRLADNFHLTIYTANDHEQLKHNLMQAVHDGLIVLDEEQTTWLVAQWKAHMFPPLPVVAYSTHDDTTFAPQHNFIRIPSDAEYSKQFIRIFSFLPALKDILIFEGKGVSTTPRYKALREVLKEKGYFVSSLPLLAAPTRRDIMHLASHDICLVLGDEGQSVDIQRLALLCREHSTLLYHTQHSSIRSGAALTFALDAPTLAAMTIQALHDLEATPINLPLQDMPYRLVVDKQALQEQGVSLHKIASVLSLMSKTSLITPRTQDKVAAYLRLEQIPLE